MGTGELQTETVAVSQHGLGRKKMARFPRAFLQTWLLATKLGIWKGCASSYYCHFFFQMRRWQANKRVDNCPGLCPWQNAAAISFAIWRPSLLLRVKMEVDERAMDFDQGASNDGVLQFRGSTLSQLNSFTSCRPPKSPCCRSLWEGLDSRLTWVLRHFLHPCVRLTRQQLVQVGDVGESIAHGGEGPGMISSARLQCS